MEYLNQFQCIPRNIFTTYNLSYAVLEKHLTFTTETHSNVISPNKVRKEQVWEPKGELIRFSDVISQDQNDDKTDLEFLNQIHFGDSQSPKYLRVEASAFHKKLHFVSVKPSVTHAEASWPVFDFWCYILQTKTNNFQLVQLNILKQMN